MGQRSRVRTHRLGALIWEVVVETLPAASSRTRTPMPSLQLTSTQRKHLRGLAHSLKVIVTVGRKGVGDSAIKEIDAALSFHELIKIRIGDGADLSKAEKRELCGLIADQVSCGVAGLVGHVAVLFRPHPDPDKRRIKLAPKR